MNDRPTEGRRPHTRRAFVIVALGVLTAVVAGAVVIVVWYTTAAAAQGKQRADQLAARIAAITESQQLVIAQLGAKEPAKTASLAVKAEKPASSSSSGVPFSCSTTETEMGVSIATARFLKVAPKVQAGWPVSMHFGSYLDGDLGFSVASSRGDIFKGTYYVDERPKTVSGTILRACPVNVYGWRGSGAGTKRSLISAADLARALARPDAVGRRWRAAWFWIKISRQGDILAATETPPQ